MATIERWPTIQPCLDRLLPQVEQAGGELILADGTADGCGIPPRGNDRYGSMTTIASPGASVLALRALAVEAASATLLAFTEDHCVVDERWLDRIVRAHDAHPDAGMVSGPVINGSTDGLIDWANFIMTFAEFMPPTPARPLKRTPPMSNASFRRSVMLGGPLPEGWLEVVLSPTLIRERRCHYDDGIVVSHVQPRRLAQALAAHFHNGRACAGLALPHMAARDWWLRMVTVPAMPWILLVSVMRSLEGRAVPPRARRSLPIVWLLSVSHAAGELTGLLRGEGLSAKRLN